MTPSKIGITGGIGSGKSVVSQILHTLGIPVYDCDAEAKRLTASHPAIREQLIALVGPEVYIYGVLNKPYLANYLFASEEHAQQINAIIHPVVKDDFRQWAVQQQCPLVAMESAILFEAGFQDEVDHILMVSAPLEIRIARAMQRDHATREAIESRIRQQLDDREKQRRSHFVIVNDGKTPVIPQVLDIINTLSEK